MSRGNQTDTLKVALLAGSFAEDKDVARKLRVEHILPAIAENRKLVIDFSRVEVATQSFIHAMISEAIRVNGDKALDLIEFKSCTRTVKSIILTVVEYSLREPLPA